MRDDEHDSETVGDAEPGEESTEHQPAGEPRPEPAARESAEAHAAVEAADERAGGDDELSRARETMLRMQADMANREKRLEREMAKARKYALESLMRDVVQVLDSMDQALASAGEQASNAAYEGMELTRKQALQVLASHGLEPLDPLGERFDPTWHEAIATQPVDDQRPDTVCQVVQKGYRLNDRLIRPARVIVAKAP